MAYRRHNYTKWADRVWAVYRAHKHYDVPDTFIVRHVFPKHNIYISYRTWQRIKSGGRPVASGNLR